MSDTPRTDKAERTCDTLGVMDAFEFSIYHGQKLERELNEAIERIKQLEQQILKAQKQKEITHKVIEQISQEGATSETIEALLNAHFWGLV
jgi:DNA-directed RNA polymerase specialized sigma subunit